MRKIVQVVALSGPELKDCWRETGLQDTAMGYLTDDGLLFAWSPTKHNFVQILSGGDLVSLAEIDEDYQTNKEEYEKLLSMD